LYVPPPVGVLALLLLAFVVETSTLPAPPDDELQAANNTAAPASTTSAFNFRLRTSILLHDFWPDLGVKFVRDASRIALRFGPTG
jgi:hypothetical protein